MYRLCPVARGRLGTMQVFFHNSLYGGGKFLPTRSVGDLLQIGPAHFVWCWVRQLQPPTRAWGPTSVSFATISCTRGGEKTELVLLWRILGCRSMLTGGRFCSLGPQSRSRARSGAAKVKDQAESGKLFGIEVKRAPTADVDLAQYLSRLFIFFFQVHCPLGTGDTFRLVCTLFRLGKNREGGVARERHKRFGV